MNKLLIILATVSACSEAKPNRAVEAAKFVLPGVECHAEDATPGSGFDTAWCRTIDKAVFFCRQGPNVMLTCQQYGVKPAPPTPPPGSPLLPETPK